MSREFAVASSVVPTTICRPQIPQSLAELDFCRADTTDDNT
jgi:hypothetical protein